jgi:hypothetical protein
MDEEEKKESDDEKMLLKQLEREIFRRHNFKYPRNSSNS